MKGDVPQSGDLDSEKSSCAYYRRFFENNTLFKGNKCEEIKACVDFAQFNKRFKPSEKTLNLKDPHALAYEIKSKTGSMYTFAILDFVTDLNESQFLNAGYINYFHRENVSFFYLCTHVYYYLLFIFLFRKMYF
jgi:hypothetical protein